MFQNDIETKSTHIGRMDILRSLQGVLYRVNFAKHAKHVNSKVPKYDKCVHKI